MDVLQSTRFRRAYKRLHLAQKADVDDVIAEIIRDPELGTSKKGDLAGVMVHRFKSRGQLMLLAYEYDPRTRHLLLLGTHENFYRDLKRDS
ncbi:type II toxin-antitoxin system RelE/ParE family toxin [Thioalkalivibrio sp. ALJ7]|uniref:type II toxin-antitoxin system RelE/ParE family toxin n=1 Tax=Thioalkalivibrio sp. ALJ7 TaxID=1158756 RepID=UPI000382747B|nr:type II toxin-antitoxin system RelE/ParE family toxin [Thioalkalivibrio sp. ALJ7]